MISRAFTKAALAALAALLGALPGHAQDDYPNRPVKIIVPFAPGGSTDVVARILADKLGAEFKQNFIVDNRPGAGGNIGADAVAKSNADGYTLLMGTTGVLAINGHLYKTMSYDAERDFAPVSYTSLITNILVVNPEVQARTVPELVRFAKSKPGGSDLRFLRIGELDASVGRALQGARRGGHPPRSLQGQLAGPDRRDVGPGDDALRQRALVDSLHPAGQAARRGGHQHASACRTFPDTPTIAESGVNGYESLSWSGIVAPAATPKPVINKLNAAIDRILTMDDVKQKFAAMGVEPVGGTPEAFARHVRSESEKWGKLVKSANITIN